MSALERDRLDRLRLTRALEAGDLALLTQVRMAGAAATIDFKLRRRGQGEREEILAQRIERADPEADLASGAALGARFVIPGDDEWPDRLDDLDQVTATPRKGGVPLGLWVRGPLGLDTLAGSVSIVGTRDATPYGAHVAQEIASTCARAGLVVVSGAAFGIDYAAHRGAVAGGGRTVAVLACGVDRPYPLAHAEMIEHFASTTAVIAEAPLGGGTKRQQFLARNRIIVALSRGTVVVEAAMRSGALNSANWAGELSRPLMGVPGPVTSVVSGGVHEELRRGNMQLVTSGREVLEIVGSSGEHLIEVPRGRLRSLDALSPDQLSIFEALPAKTPASLKALADAAVMPTGDAHFILCDLQARGLAVNEPGGWRIATGPPASTGDGARDDGAAVG